MTDRLHLDGIRAVLFDVDGTLYQQAPVRACIAAELAACALGGPRRARTAIDAIVAFRRAQEELRHIGWGASPLDALQYERAAQAIGCGARDIRPVIDEWMFTRPLKYLRAARRGVVADLVVRLTAHGIPIGVFSDYPAERKVAALGLAGRFSIALCATDPDINAFKPHPRGFLRACELWRLAPEEVLYVGDRSDTDAAGAAAAGMPFLLLGSRARGPGHGSSRGGLAAALTRLEQV